MQASAVPQPADDVLCCVVQVLLLVHLRSRCLIVLRTCTV